MWSVGCILAEIFELFKKDKRSHVPLFGGTMGDAKREGAPPAPLQRRAPDAAWFLF